MIELSQRDDITKFSPNILGEWLFKYAFILEEKGIEWAKHKSLYESLEDKKKVVLAGAAPENGTESSKEREALKSEAYNTYLEGIKHARYMANKSWVEYSAAKDKYEALRSILSNRKEEMKKGI